MSDEKRYPDAVMIPDSWKGASDHPIERGLNLFGHADRLLGVDASRREIAYVKGADGGLRFCSKNHLETPIFPTTHGRFGEQRYRWERQEDGSLHGFYLDEEAAGAYAQSR